MWTIFADCVSGMVTIEWDRAQVMWVRLGLKIGYNVDDVKSSRRRDMRWCVFAS